MSDMIQILYFAALAEQLHCSQEQIAIPPAVTTVAELQNWLVARGEPWHALASEQVRCAVNQEIATTEHPIHAGDEVAFFPPVTGG